MNARTILLGFPSIALIKQTLESWKREGLLENRDYLCVCSDDSVSDGVDEAIVRAEELGAPVTTRPEVIDSFLNRGEGARVIFSTYQSMPLIVADEPIDLAVIDEAHRTAGALGRPVSHVLSDNNIRIDKRLFMTATPKHTQADKEDAATFSMFDPEIYGQIVYALPIHEAIRKGIICDYKIVVSITTDDEIATMAQGNNTAKLDIANAWAIKSAMQEHGFKKAITFHQSVNSAKRFACGHDTMKIMGETSLHHVNGSLSSSERGRIMADFADSDTSVVTNARCLTEGIDVPSIDMVVFLAKKRSVSDIVQACGRAMRSAPGKAIGAILIPLHIHFESGETVEDAVNRSGYADIWRVIHAMREQDMMVHMINGRPIEQKWTRRIEEHIEIVGRSNLELVQKIKDSIYSIIVDRLNTRSWDESFALLTEAREKHNTWKFGNLDPDLAYLDAWIQTQLKIKRAGRIDRDKEARLRSIGFPFPDAQVRATEWDAKLATYMAGKGEGRWATRQRSLAKKGLLPKDKLEKLLKANFALDGLAEYHKKGRKGSAT